MRRSLRIIFLAWCLSLIGWSAVAYGALPMPSQPSSLCIGRFAIDLPPSARARIDASYHFIEQGKHRQVGGFDQVRRELESRVEELGARKIQRSARHDAMAKAGGFDPDSLYGSTQLLGFEVDDYLKQAILGYMPDPNSSGIVTEAHKFFNKKYYYFQIKNAGAYNFTKDRENLRAAATSFVSLNNLEVPAEPGFCVDGGMFADDGGPPFKESFTLVVRFADHPDAQFVIDAHAIDQVNKDEPSLRNRVDSELKILRANVEGRVGVIDRGEFEAAGQNGYQIAISAPYDDVPGTRIRKFFWSADGIPNDVTRPFMEVDLSIEPTDDGVSTIKTDAEAKALWDRLINALRIRRGSA